MPLPCDFYARPSVLVAPDLLGRLLIREIGSQRLIGRIVEVEAYLGEDDAASHAFRGPTTRNRSMFGPPGHAYVYIIYGIHTCLNIVTGQAGKGEAVLIRALEPLSGIEVMQRHRGGRPLRQLTNGPGKICQALAIDKSLDGHDLCAGQRLWLEAGERPDETLCAGPRVGVRGDDRALSRAWRFFLAKNSFVSRSPLNRQCEVINSLSHGNI